MKTRRTAAAIARYALLSGAAVGLVSLPATAAKKEPSSKALHIAAYPFFGGYPPECDPGTGTPSRELFSFDCERGASPVGGLRTDEWSAYGGYPVGQEPPCLSSLPGPVIANTCGDDDLPNACKGGKRTANATMDPAGEVGDPVDLSSGALELTPTDVDLGRGLRFTRHYASPRTLVGPMGRGWRHGLEWGLQRKTVSSLALELFIVKPPLRTPVPFIHGNAGGPYFTGRQDSGSLSVDPDGMVHFRDGDGTEADFDAQDRIVALRIPGEPPIAVTYGADTTTFSNGAASLVLTYYSAGHTNAGRLASIVAGGETWSYTYDSYQKLLTVTGPDLSTASPSDTVVWTYGYTASGASGLVNRIDRTAGGVTTTIASWTYNGIRVSAADEPGLEQPLAFTYAFPEANRVRTTVKDASSQTLAVFDHTNDMLLSVTNPSGPGAPLPGGVGVPVPFVSATVELVDTSTNLRWRTKTDRNGNVTLYENYDDHGRPRSIVEGWVDGPGAPGVFSVDDTWARWREYTYHPVLDEPLTISEDSAIPGAPDRVTIFDYDDPLAPGDSPAVPNESPTSRLYARIEQGSTLDASGAVVPVSATTRFTYDADGRVLSESGPRPENYTEHVYDSAGNRTATRRYLNGPASAYLETTFASFDARGNPENVTDPNGRVTTFTYDAAGRVKTVTPPYAGGRSTITSSYDVDGNLVRIDFPNDSFGQPYFLRLGYDTKNRLTFLADSAGSAIVYERTGGRVTREALYSGFVDLANRGTLKGDSTFTYDVAGRLLKAFNPLFNDNSIYSEYGHDGNENQTSVSDENGKLDTLLYDALDRLVAVQQVRGGTTYTTGYAYDAAGNVKQVTDPAGKATDYLFDDLGRLVKVTSPNTGVTIYLYDLAGNLVAKKEDATGTPRTTLHEYDGLDRLTQVDFPSDPDWLFTDDASAALNQEGRLSSVTNGVVTTELEYTDRGEISVERTLIGGGSYAVSYGYDAAGNLTSLQTPSGVTAATAYSAGRPKTVTVTAGSSQETTRNLAFLPFGPRTRAELPPYDSGSGANTVISTRTYNLRGQVSALQVTSPAGTVLDQSFTYGSVGGAPGPIDPGPNLDQVVDHRDASQSRFYFYL
jgi:YD repeat-containing protein